ncbi:MAG: DUF1624 domain-containing protein [Anaerolineae bacterium]|jgi:uncharacterized membrane protein|nr:DUF1624 domain-containing protein [Anaerolineae bacterium]MBT7072113.1 DUF1624 domain-containing protein [Anaerolineae bacterium]MBT7326762.1 DUF1624 domain-containing protein [Anaerolineae bacterium]MBT7602620.1 DUF1624 domain-containing protein [Anaerolineae bacterium]
MNKNSNSSSPIPKRIKAPDALRGLIMVFMALDHANHFVAQKHSSGEYWGGPFPEYHDALTFLVRWITHLSAPGFFFLMGIGMWLFAQSRREKDWKNSQIIRHFAVRGLVLIALQFFIVNPAWGLSPSGWVLETYVGVLFALGGTMILLSFLPLRNPRYLLPLTILFLFTNGFIPPDPWGERISVIQRLLTTPGGDLALWVNYPILPWMPLVTLGMLFGHWLQTNRDKAHQRALWIGTSFILIFFITRSLGNFWNIRPTQGSNWIAFLNVVKYPPSLTFIFLTMGINLLLLWTFSKLDKALVPLTVFGKTPLFFYISHLYLYAGLGIWLTPAGTSIPTMFLYWLLGLVILYPLCLGYARLKKTDALKAILQFF